MIKVKSALLSLIIIIFALPTSASSLKPVTPDSHPALKKVAGFFASNKKCVFATATFPAAKERMNAWELVEIDCVADIAYDVKAGKETSGCSYIEYNLKTHKYQPVPASSWNGLPTKPIAKSKLCAQGGFEDLLNQEFTNSAFDNVKVAKSLIARSSDSYDRILFYSANPKYLELVNRLAAPEVKPAETPASTPTPIPRTKTKTKRIPTH